MEHPVKGAGCSRNIAIFAVTPGGRELAGRLAKLWEEAGTGARVIQGELREEVARAWCSYDGLVMIMAAGIAVRLIAPLLNNKWTDPGVVVVDEKGQFAISLLSGHWGGGNRLACAVAQMLEGTPVITTATDVNGKAAIDLLASSYNLSPAPRRNVKYINGALLAGVTIRLFSEWDLGLEGQMPGIELHPWPELPEKPGETDVPVTSLRLDIHEQGLCLCPRSLAAGIGCKRGTQVEELAFALEEALERAGRRREGLAVLASHEAKADEQGLLELSLNLKLPLKLFPSRILQEILDSCTGLQKSWFVQQRMGVGGVCETSALAAVPVGRLVLPKTKIGKITVALAEAGWLWSESGLVTRLG